MSAGDTRVARIGQMQLSDAGQTLKAIMGSCVGIAILWRERGLYALSHCLLAESAPGGEALNAKYVSDAIPMMIDALGAGTRRERRRLEAVVVGGGRMLQSTGNPGGEEIGPANLDSARQHLARHDVHLGFLQDAADNASQLFIDGRSGAYTVVLIPKLAADAGEAGEGEITLCGAPGKPPIPHRPLGQAANELLKRRAS